MPPIGPEKRASVGFRVRPMKRRGSAVTMSLAANKANEQLNDDRKGQGKNSRHEKGIPFG
jgi:hypothetical protein